MTKNLKILLVFALVLDFCAISCSKGSDDETPPAPVDQTAPLDTPTISLTGGDAKEIANLRELLDSDPRIAVRHKAGDFGQGKKIAILDQGWMKLASAAGAFLPAGLSVEKVGNGQSAESDHGTIMAQIVYSVATGLSRYNSSHSAPTLVLYNTFGFSNLKDAVDDIVRRGDIDIVVYSQVWEFGGNFDGSGFINEVVNKALNTGLRWFNAVGNYGKTFYRQEVGASRTKDWILNSNDQTPFFPFSVSENTGDTKILAAWADFRNDFNYRTSKDLNLLIYTSGGQLIEQQRLIQDGAEHPKSSEKYYSRHARELAVVKQLPAGQYKIAIENRSKNFSEHDQFWLAINSPVVQFDTPSPIKNSVCIPADNRRVETVDANDVDFSSFKLTADGSRLPARHSAVSKIEFVGEENSVAGTSTANAVVAAKAALSLL